MAYRLEDGESADQAIRRVGAEQLDRAVGELRDGLRSHPAAAVHEARKALKKERSLLRLARGSMSSSVRRRENAVAREAGRKLAHARDAEVVVQALDGLAERHAGQLPEKTFATIRDYLNERGRGPLQLLTDSGLAGELAEELRAAHSRTAQWQLRHPGWKAIKPGLHRSYRRGRRAFKRARNNPTVERLHEWRKRVKDHWYHLRLLEPTAPCTMKGQATDAHLLSDLLGDDHDLAVLRELLLHPTRALAVDLDSVIDLLDHRRRQLQAQAMLLGERVYAEKPKQFRRRIHAYWKAWHTERTRPPIPV